MKLLLTFLLASIVLNSCALADAEGRISLVRAVCIVAALLLLFVVAALGAAGNADSNKRWRLAYREGGPEDDCDDDFDDDVEDPGDYPCAVCRTQIADLWDAVQHRPVCDRCHGEHALATPGQGPSRQPNPKS